MRMLDLPAATFFYCQSKFSGANARFGLVSVPTALVLIWKISCDLGALIWLGLVWGCVGDASFFLSFVHHISFIVCCYSGIWQIWFLYITDAQDMRPCLFHACMDAKTTPEYCRRIYSALSGHEELHRGFSLVSWASRTVEERYCLNRNHNGFGCWREDPLQNSRLCSFGYSHWKDFSFLGRSSPGV